MAKASTLSFVLMPGQIVEIINSDCRFLTTANFLFFSFVPGLFVAASVVVLLLLFQGKSYIYLFSSG